MKFQVPSPITVETDVAMDVEVAESSEILAKAGIQSGMKMGKPSFPPYSSRLIAIVCAALTQLPMVMGQFWAMVYS